MRSHGYAIASVALVLGVVLTLFALFSTKEETTLPDLSTIPGATPKPEPLSRKGNASSYVVRGKRYATLDAASGYVETGIASWYGKPFHGRETANGETYDMHGMTAAHRSLPIPTYLFVRNLRNNKKVIVRVNDRGPFYDDRLIDLSYAAAEHLGFSKDGVTAVEVRAIDAQTWPAPSSIGLHTREKANIYVGVGALESLLDAHNMRAKVSALTSVPVHIRSVDTTEGRVYEVRLGPFKDAMLAQSERQKLNHFGYKADVPRLQ